MSLLRLVLYVAGFFAIVLAVLLYAAGGMTVAEAGFMFALGVVGLLVGRAD